MIHMRYLNKLYLKAIIFLCYLVFIISSSNLWANNGIELDGVNDKITVAHNGTLDFTSAMTIEAWIKLADLDDYHNIMMKGNYGYGFAIEQTTGKLGFWDQGLWESVPLATDSVTSGSWQHVAVSVIDNGSNLTVTYYINGSSAGQVTSSQTSFRNNTGALYFGQQGTFPGNFFDGQMDEVRMWNIARSEDEIMDNMNYQVNSSESGLVAYWRCDESSGINLNDETINNNDGTLVNMDNSAWIISTSPVRYGGNILAISMKFASGMLKEARDRYARKTGGFYEKISLLWTDKQSISLLC